MEWFWQNNVGRFLGFSVYRLGADNDVGYVLKAVLWFAFPVFPLAVTAVVTHRREWKAPAYLPALVVLGTGMACLLVSASARALYLLPLIPAFTILAAHGLTKLPEWFLVYWNNFVQLVGVVAVALAWLIWISLQRHNFLHLPFIAKSFPVDFAPAEYQWLAFIVAVAATVFFASSLKQDTRQSLNAPRIWFATIATAWIMAGTLLLPWIDETKSYRPVLKQMEDYLAQSPYANDCTNQYTLGESIAPMFEYFGKEHKVNIIKDVKDATCPVILSSTEKTLPLDSLQGWKVVWRGSRALDAKNEEMRVYVKQR